MIMKKYLMSFAVLLMGAALLTACGDDDDNTKNPEPVIDPVYEAMDVSNGLFIVGSGNTRANIDGNLSYINYEDGLAIGSAFFAVNGKSVGKTANYVTIYGNKLYVVVDKEATIWVCDKNTLKIIKQLSTTALLGQTDGASPRAALGHDGKLFFTCYGDSNNGNNGVVAAVDTINFAKQETYTVGSYPDGLTLANNSIYVANSDYGSNIKPSISKIDLATKSVSTMTDPVITNPMQILTIGTDVYYLDYGTYDENYNQSGQGVRRITPDGKVTKIADGTVMGSDGKRVFAANAPYGGTPTYSIYDPATGKTTTWSPANVLNPAVIAVDPVTGNIFIVSYSPDPDTGAASYKIPTYTNQYDAAGNLVKTYYNTATGAISAVFNTDVEYVQK